MDSVRTTKEIMIMTQEQKAEAYDEALKKARDFYKGYKQRDNQLYADDLETIFPELKGSEEEKIKKQIRELLLDAPTDELRRLGIDLEKAFNWIEKQGKSSGQIHYWTEEEIEPIISDYLRGAEHYGGMIGRLRCLKPRSLEKQGEQKPIDKIQLGKKYKCIASPRYSTFMIGEIYKPEDKFLCSLMNFCYSCFEPIEDGDIHVSWEYNITRDRPVKKEVGDNDSSEIPKGE